MDRPVKELREAAPPQRPFTQADQVHQLVEAREADPDLGFMARLLALCSLPRSPSHLRIAAIPHGSRSLVLVLAGLLGCAAVLRSPPLHAASERILAAAKVCAELDWRDKGGYERAESYREAVLCFKALYVRVSAGERSSEAFEKELSRRLDDLEAAYHQSRDICRLRQQLKLEDGNCGTISLSPHEFVTMLKTMILDEDAGWVNRDPALAKALRLDE